MKKKWRKVGDILPLKRRISPSVANKDTPYITTPRNGLHKFRTILINLWQPFKHNSKGIKKYIWSAISTPH